MNTLIDATTKLSKLGMIEAGEATQYMTSMLKGFNLEVEDAISVVDKLTTVDLEAAGIRNRAHQVIGVYQRVNCFANLKLYN